MFKFNKQLTCADLVPARMSIATADRLADQVEDFTWEAYSDKEMFAVVSKVTQSGASMGTINTVANKVNQIVSMRNQGTLQNNSLFF